MSLLKAFVNLMDEKSDNSLDNVLKKLDQKLGTVEKTLGSTVDKAEAGIKKLDMASQKTVKITETVSSTLDKFDSTNSQEMTPKE